jgi:asparaginyl-tRNA synthetase
MTQRIQDILKSEARGQEITVQGWVKTKRESKNLTFLEITDGSSFRGLQVIVDTDQEGDFSTIEQAGTGASVEITGTLDPSPGKNQALEVHAMSLRVIGSAPADTYPLQKKRHSFEFLREIAHLRPRTNTFSAVTRVRNALSFAVHTFFQERGFMYIHTPIISTSDCEGAGEMFQVTTLPLDELPLKEGRVDYSRDFFGKQASLTVSGQLEAESYALAMRDVYTFGPTFRAENSNTSRHLAEFWMIEPEMAFCSLPGNMELAEEFIRYILRFVLKKCPEDMDFFSQWIEKGVRESIEKVAESSFTHVPYTEAVKLLKDSKKSFEFPVEWGSDLQSEHERFLTEEVFKGPVIVTDYPKEIKAFYMKLNEDDKTVRAMDVLVPRLGEIIGGSEREDRHDVLLNRIHASGLDPADYWWYLDLRRFGSVPHSGFGLGFERLIQYVTGMQNIRDVIPFPRTVKSAEF